MKARVIIVYLCAIYEAIRLTALYLLVYVLFPGEFGVGFGPLLLTAAMPALALIALLAAAGRYPALWHPAFISFRIYKGLTIPVWAYLLLSLATGPLMSGRILVTLAALGIVDVSSFLLSFLAPGQDDGREQPEREETRIEEDHHPKHEEIEVE